jgi:hypothetical protein
MSASTKIRCCWRRDLAEFRGLTERERSGYLLVLEWFENFRLRSELDAGREAAKLFWKQEVLREDRPREKWSRKKASPRKTCGHAPAPYAMFFSFYGAG